VIGISRSPEIGPLMGAYHRHGRERFSFHRFDLNRDPDWIQQLLWREEPEYIVNFAAQSEVGPSWDHPEHWFQTNTVGLVNLVHPLREAKWLKKYLHVSSPEVYGTCVGTVLEDAPLVPSTPYAASKAAADLYLATLWKNFRFPLVTVRSTNVYGARQQLFKIIPRSILSLLANRTIPLHGGGRAVKSYIHIRDISRGELAILEQGTVGETYHLSPEQGIEVRELVRVICTLMGRNFASATNTVDERLGQDAAYVVDSSKARCQFDWKPSISLENGLTEIIRWAEEHWDVIKSRDLDYIHKE
jgi:dTDP-glucose 4,6-dehydratase